MRGRVGRVVVVGGGHAGCEAAAAAARMGAEVVLVTLDPGRLATMPCNPAVGGVGKGHLVAEVDALGGLQGWAADRTGLQFRILNRSRGPAVWGPRAQCDKERYSRMIGRVVRRLSGVRVIRGEVGGLLVGDRGVQGVRLVDGTRLDADAVVLSTGTFLGGVLHTGERQRPGGRLGEAPSTALGQDLSQLGIELRRFKTGTPPRLHRATLDLSRMEVQRGDEDAQPFSWRSHRVTNKEVCWVTRTPTAVAEIIRENLGRSPLYGGRIEGVGPRYCPSIEDKVVRFPHHERHTLFLEPEGERSRSVYVNGLSTSLPRDVQEAVVRATPGLEQARILRYGYAVEYDVVAPLQVRATLETRAVAGLYVAGQLLGTSGYEEAAALGLMAGVNATRAAAGREPVVLGRTSSYVGVLVDDVTGRDHREPYRMLTSRAEHRLLLGVDSARERLMERGAELGLVPRRALDGERRRWEARRRAVERLEEARVNPDRTTRAKLREIAGIELTTPSSWGEILRRQDVDGEAVLGQLVATRRMEAAERRVVLGRLRYAGYVDRQRREVERVERLRLLPLPEEYGPEQLAGLSREVVETLQRHRPRTVAEAESLPGMTPAAVAILAAAARAGRLR